MGENACMTDQVLLRLREVNRSVVDTTDPMAVQAEVVRIYRTMFRDSDALVVKRAFGWALLCFSGKYHGYQAVDAGYHDLEHTLQGTLCLARLLEGRDQSGVLPRIKANVFELSLIAILFHDTGYLKEVGDDEGTGAKYTMIHVDRSVGFAGEFLREQGLAAGDITSIQQMIRCTGVNVDLKAIPFQDDLIRLAGFALGTADLVGQMAAADYPEKLPILYEEFAESAAFNGGWSANFGPFDSALHLMSQTNDFFRYYVRPKLEDDLDRLHLFLATPYPDGENAYLDAIQRNLARITEIVAAGSVGEQ